MRGTSAKHKGARCRKHAHRHAEFVTFMPLRTNTNSNGATVVVQGVGDSCGIICIHQRDQYAFSAVHDVR